MRSSLALLCLLALPLAGCVTANNYPDQYSKAYCASLFACVPEDAIEFWGGYDDADECEEGVADLLRDTPEFEAFEEGDREFDSDDAGDCIDEVAEIQSDSSCQTDEGAPNMNILDFTFDASTEACSSVYDE